MLKRYSQYVLVCLALGDLFTVAAAWTAGYGLRYLAGLVGATSSPMPSASEFVGLGAISLLLTIPVFSWSGLYAPRRMSHLSAELVAVFRATLTIWVLVYFLSILITKHVSSRMTMAGMLASWVLLASVFRVTVRTLIRHIRRHNRNLRHAAIVGTGRLAQRFYHALKRNPWTGIATNFFIGDTDDLDQLWGLKVYRPIELVEDIVAILPVDIVFVALPRHQRHKLDFVISQLSKTRATVCVVPDLLSNILLKQKTFELDDLAVVSLTSSPQHEWRSAVKRGVDLLGASLALAVLGMPMLIIAGLIKATSRGPVFYRQVRASLASRPFRMIKFRSMMSNAEHQTGPVYATQDDPRITRVGKFLRRTSLDELPQLFNVLTGHMSLVGPRPERPEIVERLRQQLPRYMLRTQVKPGMTGLAQIRGYRGRTSLRKRVQYDLYYVSNWSLWLDAGITLRTLLGGFLDRGPAHTESSAVDQAKRRSDHGAARATPGSEAASS